MYARTAIDIIHLLHAHIVYVRTCTVYSICICTCVARGRVPAHVRSGPKKKNLLSGFLKYGHILCIMNINKLGHESHYANSWPAKLITMM